MSAIELANKECIPCKKGALPLQDSEINHLLEQLQDGWRVVNEHQLEREYKFNGYKPAVEFTNKIADIAESQNHHPEILLEWGKVKVTVWTHKVNGLTESDFIFAAKLDQDS